MWKKQTIEPDRSYQLKLGQLTLFLRKTGKKWLYKSEISDTPEVAYFGSCDESEATDYQICIADKSTALSILPALPDKPLVVRPEKNFKLQPKSSIQLKLQIPIWVQLYHGTAKKENLIHEEGTKVLSKTWLGEPDNGQLAYSFRFQPNADALDEPNYATCPVKISNDSSSVLEFQHLLLEVDQLSLYQTESNTLLTSSVSVKFKGEQAVSDQQYSEHKPEGSEPAKKIADPRSTEKRNALQRSFFFIKSLTQY